MKYLENYFFFLLKTRNVYLVSVSNTLEQVGVLKCLKIEKKESKEGVRLFSFKN